MSVYFDKSRQRWVAEVNEGRRRVRHRCTAENNSEAAARELEAAALLRLKVAPPPPTIPAAAFPNSIDALVRRHASRIFTSKSEYGTTAVRYAHIMDRVLGFPKLTEITTSKVADMVDVLVSERDIADATINKYLSCLRRIMHYAKDLAEEFPGVEVRLPKFPFRQEGGHRPRFLQPPEQSTLLAKLRATHDDSAEAAIVFLSTGARMSEVFEAQPDWVRPGWLIVPPSHSKTGVERQIPLTPQAEDILRSRLPWARLNLRTFRYDWNKARTEMGLDEDPFFVPYILRHTWATRAVKTGINLRVIQEMLGHSDIKTTIRYTKVEQESLADAAAKVSQAFLVGVE